MLNSQVTCSRVHSLIVELLALEMVGEDFDPRGFRVAGTGVTLCFAMLAFGIPIRAQPWPHMKRVRFCVS